MRSLGSGSSRARSTSSVAAASAAPCAARRGEVFSPIFRASANGSGSVLAASANGVALARLRTQKQTSGRAKRPGKTKTMKPPLSKNTGAAKGGAAAQRRLNEKAGIKNVERRRRRACDGDSRRKRRARRDRQCSMFDYEHQHGRVESGELRQLGEIECLRLRLEMHAAQKFHGCRIHLFVARHLRLWHLALQAAIPCHRHVRERRRRQSEGGDPAAAISCHERHYEIVPATRIAHRGESSKSRSREPRP